MRIFRSYKNTITAAMLAVAILAVLLVGGIWILQEYSRFKQTSIVLRKEYMDTQRQIIKSEVDRVVQYIIYKRTLTESSLHNNLQEKVQEAIAIADHIYQTNRGKLSEQEISQHIIEALRPIRFNEGRGYFFIYRLDGTNLLLPFSPELEGTNLLHLQDSKGNYTILRAQKLIRNQKSGFLTWYWYHPLDASQMREKIGFVQEFKPLNWWIGTGEYEDDFEKSVQQEILLWIRSIRYGKDGYIFVSDYQGKTLAHFDNRKIGVNEFNYEDANHTKVLQRLIQIAQKNKGDYLEYIGALRPSTNQPAQKISYARGIQDWQWMIGSGIYTDEMDIQIAAMRENLIHKIQRHILIICFALAACILFISLISRFLARMISKDLIVFTDFFNDAVHTGKKIHIQKVFFSELQGVAESANNMIEKRSLAEKELKEVQDQLLQSRKMEALGILAGGVAHDLNNVLSAMVGYPDLLLHTLPPECKERDFIAKIKESGEKAASIVEDLLTLSRRSVAQRQILDMNELLEQYLQSPVHEKLLQHFPNIKVTISYAPELFKIKGSEIHVQKTIMNLINNAAESQPAGGQITITTTNRYVDSPIMGFQRIEPGEYVVLTVSDRGTGIDSKDMEHIFEPFFSKKKLGRSGSGLGMAIVWGAIQDHEGFIDVQTQKNAGTTFILYFPATREERTAHSEENEIATYRGQGEHILVVDDMPDQRELASTILHNLGYRTTEASTGQEAITILQSTSMELVLLDMIMEDPQMDGLDTYRKIIRFLPEQKTIIASGYAETDRVKEALRLGVRGYVKKPYTIAKIGITIRKVLDS